MSKRRRRRVRRHRRSSVPGEVRKVGFLVDGDWPDAFRGPVLLPFIRSPRRSAGPLLERGQGMPSPFTGSGFWDPPAVQGQPSVVRHSGTELPFFLWHFSLQRSFSPIFITNDYASSRKPDHMLSTL